MTRKKKPCPRPNNHGTVTANDLNMFLHNTPFSPFCHATLALDRLSLIPEAYWSTRIQDVIKLLKIF